jgi:hypothetical protein
MTEVSASETMGDSTVPAFTWATSMACSSGSTFNSSSGTSDAPGAPLMAHVKAIGSSRQRRADPESAWQRGLDMEEIFDGKDWKLPDRAMVNMKRVGSMG